MDNLQNEEMMKKWPFVLVWMLAVIGALAVLPALQGMGIGSGISVKLVAIAVAQAVVIFGIACSLSYLIVSRTDLIPFPAGHFVKRQLIPGAALGICVGLTLFLLDKTVFGQAIIPSVHIARWKGALASLYGGVCEEVLLRLFMFSLIYLLFMKVVKFERSNRIYFLWVTNIFVALLFGLGHLPAAFQLGPVSLFICCRILVLNGIASVAFGWIYWSRGLPAAISAHLIADLVLYAVIGR